MKLEEGHRGREEALELGREIARGIAEDVVGVQPMGNSLGEFTALLTENPQLSVHINLKESADLGEGPGT